MMNPNNQNNFSNQNQGNPMNNMNFRENMPNQNMVMGDRFARMNSNNNM